MERVHCLLEGVLVFCAYPEVSDAKLFPTFARTRPSNTQISRSVSSLLLSFGWMKVSFLYSTYPDSSFKEVSRTIVSALDDAGIQIKYLGTWSYIYHHGYGENPFNKLVEQSYQESRSEYFQP
ncbi:ANF_receptor domain-containing protein [Caerostris extrusa]|uniref:ANF_receptor domain-containing protein n=1 Tax=Caerostris extrusa TaxID=172846 RepID=A0AAV4NNU3_CAEEX|nr:ANF_receptor domain-containing protein [Caerostris extrusa]